MKDGDGFSDAVQESLLVVEKKLSCLNSLGVPASVFGARLQQAREKLERGETEEARKAVDELLVFFSILAEEVDAILARMDSGAEKKEGAKRESGSPVTLDEIEQTVEEAFLKHLHSSGLRRMVEVISLEKIRSVMGDEEFYQKVVRKGVERALAEREEAGGEKEAPPA